MNKLCKGTVKVCKNVKAYIRDGDTSFVPEFRLRTMQFGYSKSNISLEYENQTLIKIKNNKYFWLKGKSILYTLPTEEKRTFVDESTVNLYSENNSDIKKLGKSLIKN